MKIAHPYIKLSDKKSQVNTDKTGEKKKKTFTCKIQKLKKEKKR